MIANVNGAELYYEEYGAGKRVILSCAQHYDPDRKGWPFDLAEEGFHVYTVTMRGYGPSTHITKDFENSWYDVWADDAAGFAQAKGIDRFLYTGQSDGAGVGWHLCFRHPEILLGFVGLAAGPHSRRTKGFSAARQNNMQTISDPVAAEQLAQYQKQRILHFARKFADNPELREEFERKAEKVYQWQMDKTPEEKKIHPGITLPQFKTDQALLDAMEQIDFPVLLINGMKDAMLPISDTVLTMGAIPNAKVVFYQDGTNFVQYDHRADVRREITAFADEIFRKL